MFGTQRLSEDRLSLALREAAGVAGAVATYLDKSEHNETGDPEVIRAAGRRLRALGSLLAEDVDANLIRLYADRIEHIESISMLEPLLPPVPSEIRRARTWRDLQVAQLRHDRHFHPDVFGLSKRDQLVHIALHLSKLVGALALLDAERGGFEAFVASRLPDLVLFGIKLSTVAGERLSGDIARLHDGAARSSL